MMKQWMVRLAVWVLVTLPLTAQQMVLSKDTLTFGNSYGSKDELRIINTGAAPLVIDSLAPWNGVVSYPCIVAQRETTYSFSVGRWMPVKKFIVVSGDTLRLTLSHPACAVCKTEWSGSDTITIRSNSLVQPLRKVIVHYDGSLDVTEKEVLPSTFTLGQNFPNPFNPSTSIPFTLAQKSRVTLTVHNALGRRIAVLQNGVMEAGEHLVRWNADGVSSGTYFYSLTADGHSATRAMMLLR